MEINERTKTTFGFIGAIFVGLIPIVVLASSFVNNAITSQVAPIETRVLENEKRNDRIANRLVQFMDSTDQKLLDIHRLLIDLNRPRK